MWNPDIWIAVASVAINAVMAFMGVQLTLHPAESRTAKNLWRGGFAISTLISCVLIWIATSRSFQSQESIQSELNGKITILQKTVDTFGPKLDAIIANPKSPEQEAIAKELASQLRPRVVVLEPTVFSPPTGEIAFNSEAENTGGSVAKRKSDCSKAILAVKDKSTEDELFKDLYRHENDSDIKPLDLAPGPEHRITIADASPILSPVDRADFVQGKKVVYLGILVTYFDAKGHKYHTEKCMYLDYQNRVQGLYCDSHNRID